ncbi:adenylate/guanylate cyclase domain-containing protein [uncultured Tateyamaria sp.]|uniref:adenylate/guanylate cyclase domain-containing protein n=1 Tax=uncultured Tateyamaria sp. TaxID=455651 RepID=UPI00260C1399|nr:adenylate/guanylate cyclase domain-containing protein [uncultured Tateyamaria sp.]
MKRKSGRTSVAQTDQSRLHERNTTSFEEAERRGLMLAAQVRMIAMSVIIVWVAVDSPNAGISYYYDVSQVAVFAVLGAVQWLCFRQKFFVHTLKYIFVFLDCALLAAVFTFPDPFDVVQIPPAVRMDGSTYSYFFILLMQATFSLRPSLVIWCGICMALARTGMLLWFLNQPDVFTNQDLQNQSVESILAARADPNFLYLGFWAIDIMVSLLVAVGLSVVVRRSRHLVERRTVAERSRANLARYFSPNVVDHLSTAQDALGGAREQKVAVLFADIMGFTKMCEHEPPEAVIQILREYHNRLGEAVFANNGTLDKYMGDGLMASFGTPDQTPNDATNALQCAIDMIASLEVWNSERRARNQNEVRVGIGLSYGTVVVGDIGNERRLEYSVIGDVVNVASRLEKLTRTMNSPLVVSDDLVSEIVAKENASTAALFRLGSNTSVQVKGRSGPVSVWTLQNAATN